jgi:hypothetical protein
MELKRTSLKPRRAAFTLAEMIVGAGVASMFTLGAVAFYIFSMTSFASIANYSDFNKRSRNTSDVVSKDIRSALSVASATSSQLVLNAPDLTNVTYTFDASGRTLTRSKGNDVRTVLKDLNSVAFSLYARPLTNSSYNQFPTGTVATAKMVSIKWSCSRMLVGSRTNSEDIQEAIVSLRNQ